MADDEVVDIDPDVLEEDALFLEEDDDLGLGGELGDEEDLDFKLSPEEE